MKSPKSVMDRMQRSINQLTTLVNMVTNKVFGGNRGATGHEDRPLPDDDLQADNSATSQAAASAVRDTVLQGQGLTGELPLQDPPLAPIDKKLVNKPDRYDGDLAKYPEWQDDFKDFLEVADHRWRPLLEAIEEHTSPPTNANYVHICVKTGVTDKLLDFQKQSHSYVKTFAHTKTV